MPVSEETGEISVAHRGHLVQGLDPDGLRAFLATTLAPSARRGNWFVENVRRLIGALNLQRAVAAEETPAVEPLDVAPEKPEEADHHREARP